MNFVVKRPDVFLRYTLRWCDFFKTSFNSYSTRHENYSCYRKSGQYKWPQSFKFYLARIRTD